MNIQDYIASGILEEYVADLLSDKEKREVEAYARQYPEIKDELTKIEIALENYAFSQAKAPQNNQKQAISEKIQAEEKLEQKPQAKIVQMPNNRFSYAMAASMIGFAISAFFNFYLTEQLKDAKGQIATLKSEKSRLVDEYDVLKTSYDQKDNQLAAVTNENTKKLILSGTPAHSDSKLTIYWESKSQTVIASIENLPPAPEGKQYQLWAIGSEGPVDAGMLSDSSKSFQQMKSIGEAAAFAITLEKQGGSPTPTLDEMYAIGKF
jgi:anti-sigma-K factor RskA